MMKITDNLFYEKIRWRQQTVHVIKFSQKCPYSTLLLSKLSEAISPHAQDNHIGEGCHMEHLLEVQKGVRLVINGGFNHYRKNFYEWPHPNFNIGDPVGLVKIRQHLFEDYHALDYYGFFTQKVKGDPWVIAKEPDRDNKYILGCTPQLIREGQKISFPDALFSSRKKVTPPSILAHGLQNHPRTAIGITNDNIYFVIVESGGCTLLDLQDIGMDLKINNFLNLDGGGSSQFRLYHEGQYLENFVEEEDKKRILGHAIVIFDKTLICPM